MSPGATWRQTEAATSRKRSACCCGTKNTVEVKALGTALAHQRGPGAVHQGLGVHPAPGAQELLCHGTVEAPEAVLSIDGRDLGAGTLAEAGVQGGGEEGV